MNNVIITAGKEELCNMLNVSSKALQHIITRKQLEDRLNKAGYKLIKEYKVGRYKAYDIEIVGISEWAKLQLSHNIKKEKQHTLYSFIRLTNMQEPRSKLIKDNDIDISNSTAGHYDKILEGENAMKFDKYVYYKTNKEGLWEEITIDYYKAFWVELREYKYIVSTYRQRLKKQEISQDTYDLVISNLYDTIERFKGYMVVKFKTYKEAENTKKVLDMIRDRNIIKNTGVDQ